MCPMVIYTANYKKYINILQQIYDFHYVLFFIYTHLFGYYMLNIKTSRSRLDFFNIVNFFKVVFLIIAWFKVRLLYYANNWIYTTNHKRIAINYFWFVILSGIVGMVLATLLRLEFAYPGVGIFAGDSLQYLSMVTAHGVIMVFFMIMPLLFGAFANFLLPTQLGVHDVAFPRLNSAAFWFLPGGLLMLCQLVCVDRRYQRMNCFNIREIQSLLKRKFFTDLINVHDHHQLLNNTAMGVRFKTNNINTINGNVHVFYNYGIEFTPKIRHTFYKINSETIDLANTSLNQSSFFFFIINLSRTFNLFNFFNNIYIFLFKYLYLTSNLFLGFKIFLNNVVAMLFTVMNNGYTCFTTLFNTSLSFFVMIFSDIKNFKSIILLFTFFPLNFSATFFELLLNFINNNFYFYLQLLNFKMQLVTTFVSNNKIITFKSQMIYALIENFLINIYEFFFFLQYLEIYNKTSARASATFDEFGWLTVFSNEKFTYSNLSYIFFFQNYLYQFDYFSQNFYENIYQNFENNTRKFDNITDVSTFKNFYFNNVFSIKFDYNSYLVYLYVWIYFIITAPLIIWELVKNFFNAKEFTILCNEIYDFFSNWFLPLLITDNVFYFTFKKLNFFNPYDSTADFNTTLCALKLIFETFFSHVWSNLNFIFKIKELTQTFNLLILIFLNFFEQIYFIIKALIVTLFGLQTHIFFNIIYKFLTSSIDSLHHIKNYDAYSFISSFFVSSNAELTVKHLNEELSNSARYLRFSNPLFRYDYKAGDYFPKLYKEIYSHLFTTINDLTGGLRTTQWFNSEKYIELLNFNFLNYSQDINKFQFLTTNDLRSWTPIRFNGTDGFYNFFFSLTQDLEFLNKRWVSFDVLNQKFYRMFNTSSMQQRIYSNWRQLKFTREAWRCKLLAARHQKTLFRRYANEDGVFWSIEKNARDLLPGWAMITPFSSRTRFTAVGKTDIGLMGVLLVLNSSIISAANFLVTYRYLATLNNRKMRDARAFFTEGIMVASWMMIAANPMLVIGIIMLISDRHWQTSFFDYSGGGDTVLFQHMFWFFGHPEVYIIIIPTFGFTNTILSFYLKKRISARASLLYSMYTIAFLGFFVWGHHMYMVGLAHTTRMLFSTLTVMISVPAATKIMHWCVTIVNSSFATELPLLFIITFIFFFITGGISGMCVAHTGMDVLFHDTFYVVGHFHVMLAGCAMFASFGAFYFYFPAIFGVKFSRIYAYLHYAYYLLGQLMTVIPMIWLGYAGMPRRVLDYPASMGGWHSVISAGHMLSVAGLMAFFIMIFDSLRQGRAVIRNTFGISRYNTCLNFYLYEIAHLIYAQQKGWTFFRFIKSSSIKLNGHNYTNFETYETTLLTYTFAEK